MSEQATLRERFRREFDGAYAELEAAREEHHRAARAADRLTAEYVKTATRLAAAEASADAWRDALYMLEGLVSGAAAEVEG